MKDMERLAAELNGRFENSGAETVLEYFLAGYAGRIALASSLGLEDQVLTDMVCRLSPGTRIFTLDTGRLFPEAYHLIDRTNDRYGIKTEVFFPDCEKVQEMVSTDGINLFYDSIEKRKRCCQVRKIEPLRRAFRGMEAWICGLRREQSVTRADNRMVEWDQANGLLKINPLIDWSEDRVRDYIRKNQVPYNKLHDKGYPSIGCQPCTRTVEEGEDIRAGRWWWESPDHKECGLHRR